MTRISTAIVSSKRPWRSCSLNWNGRNSSGLASRILAYLKSRPDLQAGSDEIVRDVMALSGVSPALAGRLVETALDGLEQVERTPDGCWRVAEPAGRAVRDVPFVCVAVEQAREGRNVRLGWSVVQGGELSPAKTVTLAQGKDVSAPRLPAGCHFVVFTRKKAGLAEALRWLKEKAGADAPVWELRRAVQNLFPGRQVREPAQVARLLGETWFDEAPVDAQAERLAGLWLRVLEIAGELGLG
ncbi:MAG TPA: hypothetical protein ENK07_06190, partial [Bacteroidetes bacterium]|nr:hypothetical protein [Bacteroidota bacterium]